MHPGPFCPRHGTVSLQWSQHDGVPHPQHRKLSGVVYHREVVNGAATSPTQTGLGAAGWIHDGRHKYFYAAYIMHMFCCACNNMLMTVLHTCTTVWPNRLEARTAPFRALCCRHLCLYIMIFMKVGDCGLKKKTTIY